MNTQVNVRFPEDLLVSAQAYADKKGYGSMQDLIRETVREKVFEDDDISSRELELVRLLLRASKEHDLFDSEEELLKKLE